jgi:transposase-like protein
MEANFFRIGKNERRLFSAIPNIDGFRYRTVHFSPRNFLVVIYIHNADGPSGWTNEQTSELVALVKEMGSRWTEIAKKLQRTAYTCRAAYKRYVDKDSGRNLTMPRQSDRKLAKISPSSELPWNSETDEILKNKVLQYGRRWSSIGLMSSV